MSTSPCSLTHCTPTHPISSFHPAGVVLWHARHAPQALRSGGAWSFHQLCKAAAADAACAQVSKQRQQGWPPASTWAAAS